MKSKKKFWIITAAAIAISILLIIAYFAWMSEKVMDEWQNSHGKPSDCAIVLGAAVWDGKPSTAMKERLNVAFQVYRDKLAGHIILSGGVGSGDQLSEAQVMKAYLLEKGVPETAILMEEQSHSTIENLLNSRKIMQERGYSSAIVVTHGFHALRSRLMAESIGIPTSVEPVQIRPIDLKYYVMREAAAITVFELKRFL
jgi:uncharacterized SAM-binding protein YcdF (DUF218 family)